MAEPEKRICPTCGGSGYLYDEATDTREPCNCKVAEFMLRHLGAEIAKAPTIFKSPLYELPQKSGDSPPLDRTKDNLRIKCFWTDLLSHLKLCLWTKGIFYKFHIVTDEKIRTVYVGSESYKQRSKSKRDDVITYNSLSDLLGEEYDFVIIRLGHLGYKNAAAPGAVKESLMLRDVAQKPTWIIEEPNSPFGPGNFTWSDDLQDYIDQHFKTVALQREHASRTYEPRGYEGAYEFEGGVEDVSATAPAPRPARQPGRIPVSAIGVDEDLPGDGYSGKSKYKGGSSFKKKGGGGPV